MLSIIYTFIHRVKAKLIDINVCITPLDHRCYFYLVYREMILVSSEFSHREKLIQYKSDSKLIFDFA